MFKKIILLLVFSAFVVFNASPAWAFEGQSEDNKIVTEFKFLPLNLVNLKTLISSIDKIK